MDSCSGALSFARSLLALERARATGVLRVDDGQRCCRLALVDGVLCAASGELGDPGLLGDRLFGDGSLDPLAHANALRCDAPSAGAPVGRWLVRVGLSTRGAVETGLRRQLRDRVARLAACAELSCRFVAGAADVGTRPIAEPERTSGLVLAVLRARFADWDAERVSKVLGSGPLQLSACGQRFVASATLWPDEQVAAALLARGCTGRELAERTRTSARALRLALVLSRLGLLDDSGRYGLLLRKRRQMRDAVAPQVLLETPADVSADDARRALRRLARDLHPDRFSSRAPPAVLHVSEEVMGALASAERDLARR